MNVCFRLIIAYFLLSLMLISCGMFNQTKSIKEKEQLLMQQKKSLELQLQHDWLRDSSSFIFHIDSASRKYAVQLWPVGTFTYSAENGFIGQASQVLIIGNAEEVHRGKQFTHVHEQDNGKLGIRSEKLEELKSDRQEVLKTSSLSWKWMIAGFGLIFLLSIIGYQKIFKS